MKVLTDRLKLNDEEVEYLRSACLDIGVEDEDDRSDAIDELRSEETRETWVENGVPYDTQEMVLEVAIEMQELFPGKPAEYVAENARDLDVRANKIDVAREDFQSFQ